jgi:hypothetical protein
MIAKFGFGKTLGLYAPRNDDGSGRLAVSDSVVRRVDEEIKVHYYCMLYITCSVCEIMHAP